MNTITVKKKLTPNVNLFQVESPLIAAKARPGQFVIVRINEKGERVPITIADAVPEKGTVTIIFAEVGKTSKKLGKLKEGEEILNFAGPLGNPLKIQNYGSILCVGGGVMIGALLYAVGAFKIAGNKVSTVIGARSSEHLFMEEEAKTISDQLYISTDDGSAGQKGLGFLADLLREEAFDHVFTMGPTSMQKQVSELTKPHEIPTTVHLYSIMVDGMGMCGACRVTVGGETRFACVDGPDFDGHQVDFDELISRMRYFNPQEKISMILNHREVD